MATEAEKKLTELKHRMRTITNPVRHKRTICIHFLKIFTNDEGFVAISRKLEELGKHHAQARLENMEKWRK